MSKGKSFNVKCYNVEFIDSFVSQYQLKLIETTSYPLGQFIKYNNFDVPLRTAKHWLEARDLDWFGNVTSDAKGCRVVAYFNDSRTSGSLVTMKNFHASSGIKVSYSTFTRWVKKYVAQVFI